eukprot:6173168-Pleurochrysis_carterae.AAC.3
MRNEHRMAEAQLRAVERRVCRGARVACKCSLRGRASTCRPTALLSRPVKTLIGERILAP